MLIDLPQETVQIITQKAQTQGISVAQLLNKAFCSEPELLLNSELTAFTPNKTDSKVIQELLDNPPVFNQELQNLLALTKDM